MCRPSLSLSRLRTPLSGRTPVSGSPDPAPPQFPNRSRFGASQILSNPPTKSQRQGGPDFIIAGTEATFSSCGAGQASLSQPGRDAVEHDGAGDDGTALRGKQLRGTSRGHHDLRGIMDVGNRGEPKRPFSLRLITDCARGVESHSVSPCIPGLT